jgi:Skp family chaperone for outer membrane proteins
MARVFVVSCLLGCAAVQAIAADPQAPAAVAAEALGGSPVPGVCLLSRQAVVGNAKVGQAANARLQELAQQAQAEVDSDRKAIAADNQALKDQQAKLKPAEFQEKQQTLQQRVANLEQKARQRSREIEATREKALSRISEEAQPLIAEVYKAHKCGLLVDRNVVLGGNLAGDLTTDVVKALDAKITTITFDRETLPPQTAGR